MDRLAYIAMSGAKQTMQAQAVVSNNIANAGTTGFRAELVGAAAAPVYGDGHASRVNTVLAGYGADFASGPVKSTGRPLDVAVNGQGWIAVQTPDGGEAYTRAGDLKLDAFGLLTTGTGHSVLGEGGPIAVPPHSQLSVGGDGTVSVVPLGQTATTLAVIDRIKLVNPDSKDLTRGSDGLFRRLDGDEAAADANVQVMSGTLEGSNVSAAGELVNMIELARMYEAQIKLITTAKDDAEAAARLMHVS